MPAGSFTEIGRLSFGGEVALLEPAGDGVDVRWVGERSDGGTEAVLHTVRVGPGTRSRETSAERFTITDTAEGVRWVGSAGGADWGIDVGDDHRFVRIDGMSRKVLARYDITEVGFVEQIVGGAGAVWLASRSDEGAKGGLYRIDPDGTDSARVPIEAAGVWAGDEAVWATDVSDDAVVRVDPRSLEVVARIAVEGPPDGVVSGGGTVWVTNFDDAGMRSSVHRIDASTNRLIDTVEMGDPSGAYALVLEAHASSRALWALLDADEEGGVTLVRVDARTGAVARHPVANGSRTFALAGGDLWLAAGRTVVHYRAG